MAIAWRSDDRSDTGTSRAGALPARLTTFIGRAGSRVDVADLLVRHRLVTLTGPGGCGKTRLALEVATDLPARCGREGVFVDLAPIESRALVVNSFAAACGVSETGTAPLAELVVQTLGDRPMLVVLDNCEHVVDECATLVHELLVRCSGITVLATSREPLAVEGEITYRVPPLTVPDDGDDAEAALRASEAGQLFVDRAELARPGYRLDEPAARAAISVCRRLDGLPLALELAANRLRAMDTPELAEALAEHFDVLGEGPRTAPPRQRTLEASIAWSHELLDDRERRLFRRLGAFAASFSTEGAAAVCADPDLLAREVLAALTELVDRSLVQLDDSSGPARYRLLDALREYARSRLDEAGETAATRDRHLEHHLTIAEQFAAGRASERELETIGLALDDLRTAIDWSVQRHQVDKGLRLAAALRAFWVGRSRTAEGRAHLAALLAADTGRDITARTSALLVAAQLANYAADSTTVRELATEALELSRASGDGAREGEALILLGWAAAFPEPSTARSLLTRGLGLLGDAGPDRVIEFGEIGLAFTSLNEGNLAGAASAFSDAVEAARARGTWAMRFCVGMLGYVETLRGRFRDADALLREAVANPYGAYERFNEDLPQQWLALLQTFRGEYEDAASIHADSLARAAAKGSVPVYALLHSALLDFACGNLEQATSRATDALLGLQRIGWRALATQALRVLGDAAAARGDHDIAEAHWREAATTAASTANPVALALGTFGLARIARARHDNAGARGPAQEALRHALRAGYRIGAIDAVELLATVGAEGDLSPSGTDEDVAKLLAAVDAERARTGYVRFPVARPGFDHAVGLAREALDTGFESAWTEGSVLSFDDSIALAYRGERRPPRPPTGWSSLTPAERRVADLVADGLTNPEIGERLFISARTVQTHLSRVFAKLGVSGRTELAAAVTRRETLADTSG